jgi:hypothetical protein
MSWLSKAFKNVTGVKLSTATNIGLAAATFVPGLTPVALLGRVGLGAARATQVIKGVTAARAAFGAVKTGGAQMSMLGMAGPIVRAGARVAARTLPGLGKVGRVGAGAIGAGVVTGAVLDRFGREVRPRRRGRGFSARDVRQAKRMMKMLKDVSKAAPTKRAATKGVCGCR